MNITDSASGDPAAQESARAPGLEMPRPTIWPIVVALGVTMLGAGWATHPMLSVVGAVLFVLGLGGWISQLLPGKGHLHEPLVAPA